MEPADDLARLERGGPVVRGRRRIADVRVRHEGLDGMRRHGCLFTLTMHPFPSGRPGSVVDMSSMELSFLEVLEDEVL